MSPRETGAERYESTNLKTTVRVVDEIDQTNQDTTTSFSCRATNLFKSRRSLYATVVFVLLCALCAFSLIFKTSHSEKILDTFTNTNTILVNSTDNATRLS